MDERLLIPVADLPGLVPDGAPKAQTWDCGDPSHPATVYTSGAEPSSRCSICGKRRTIYRGDYLDLSPPPTDANGYPLRIDGLDVAVGMLARALRVPNVREALLSAMGSSWALTCGGADWHWFCATDDPSMPGHVVHHVPALADIDPTDPLAPRLAAVACFRARVWEGR